MTMIDGYELTWRRTGTGRPLALLHGITDSSACWSRVMGDLSDEFDVVALDARGHGRSARWTADMTPAQLADDAAAVIRELYDVPVAVWGHSMGAATATLLAARHPDLVAAVVLEDPPYTTSPADDTHQIARMVTGIGQMLAMVRETPEAERLAVAQAMNPAWDPADLPGWVESKLEFDESVLTGRGAIDRDWRTPMASVTAPYSSSSATPPVAGRWTRRRRMPLSARTRRPRSRGSPWATTCTGRRTRTCWRSYGSSSRPTSRQPYCARRT